VVHNKTGPWQENFRSGPLDLVLARYALGVIGWCDGLAVTHVDKFVSRGVMPVCWEYRHGGRVLKDLERTIPNDLRAQEALGRILWEVEPILEMTKAGVRAEHALVIGEALGTPVALTSGGKTASSKTEVRRLVES
jgi:adenylosuccinate synthase